MKKAEELKNKYRPFAEKSASLNQEKATRNNNEDSENLKQMCDELSNQLSSALNSYPDTNTKDKSTAEIYDLAQRRHEHHIRTSELAGRFFEAEHRKLAQDEKNLVATEENFADFTKLTQP